VSDNKLGAVSSSFMPVSVSSGTLEEAFPDVDPNFEPFGSLVLLQIQIAKGTVGEANFVLPDEVRATIQANTQVAKVLSHGPLAFCNRTTGQPWPEGAWAHPGEYVRVPKHGPDRWEIKHGDGVVVFITMRDLDLPGRIPRPLDVIAYV
jgi:hypothetical protein